jgi:hypothetical protein
MSGYADCLAEFISGLGLGAPHVAGLSFGGALRSPSTAPHRRRGERWYWHRLCRLAGSLPPGVSEQRLQEALTLADLSAEEFVGALLPTMFSEGTPADVVAAFGVRPCARSAPSAFGPWPGHRPRMSP